MNYVICPKMCTLGPDLENVSWGEEINIPDSVYLEDFAGTCLVVSSQCNEMPAVNVPNLKPVENRNRCWLVTLSFIPSLR